MKRRQFIGMLLGTSLLAGGPVSLIRAAVRPGKVPKRLIVVFLRGGVDGLSIVVPYGDPEYVRGRPNIALAHPSQEGGVTDLNGQFGIHPALGGLLPFWNDKTLAFVHACGSPDSTRSHFDAQDFMETGIPGNKNVHDGWMNRLIGVMPDPTTPIKAINAGATLPRIFQGPKPVANVALGPGSARHTYIDRPGVLELFSALYAGDTALAKAYREGYSAHRQIQLDLDKDLEAPDNGAFEPKGFAGQAHQLGRLIDTDPEIRLAFLSVGGWDTHVNQGASTGQLANNLTSLGEGLVQLCKGLGHSYQNTVTIVLSEFGRTVHENGSHGTDHGHGNVMWLLGGPLKGGKILCKWPGLQPQNLFEARDLAVTTDFRAVIAGVLQQHIGLEISAIQKVFPGFRTDGSLEPLIRTQAES